MRRFAVWVLLSLGPLAVAAQAQVMADTVIASAPATPPPPYDGERSISEGWLGVARHSPSNLFGSTKGRDVVVSVVRLRHPFLHTGDVAWDYVVELVPALWVSAGTRARVPAVPAHCPPSVMCIVPIENRHAVLGFGGSPAGLALRFRSRSRVQPFFAMGAGALWFREPMPMDYANRFNFMADAGAGILVARPGALGLVVGYTFLHISNGGLAPANPGLDNHVFYAGVVRLRGRDATTHAQSRADGVPVPTRSLVGRTRVALDAGASRAGVGATGWWAAGSLVRFVSEHWQIGISPGYRGAAGRGAVEHGTSLSGTANLSAGGDRWRGYVGAWSGAANGSHRVGTTHLGAQLGALRFLSAASALRAELRWRRRVYPYSGATADGLVTIDPYIFGRAGDSPEPPSLGTLDVAGVAYASFRFERERSVRVMLAPFVTSWSQLGVALDRWSVAGQEGRFGAHSENAFARLYAPISVHAVPFAHAFVERSAYADGIPGGGLSGFGAMGGTRHYFNRGAALDVGVQWLRHTRTNLASRNDRSPDEITIQARIITQLRTR